MGKVVSVICSSHTPGFMVPSERWQVIYEYATSRRTTPLPVELESETPAVNARQFEACRDALNVLRTELHKSEPDLVVMFGDDQNENFDGRYMPPFCVFIGESTFGYPLKLLHHYYGEDPGPRVEVPCAADVATLLVREAASTGFDLPWSREFPDKDWGLPHSMIRIVDKLDIDVPLIPVHVNAFYEPAPTPARCLQLGRELKRILEQQTPEDYRIAVIGSGGLSHEARGENAGFIDAEHDQWVLEEVRAGRGSALAQLTNDDLIRCANHELRNWIAALGFMDDRRPDYLEYVLAYRSLVGNGFAAWRLA
jgi:hypothetical protein